MYPDNESYYKRHRLRPRTPTPPSSQALRQATRKIYLWITALVLELGVTLCVGAIAVAVLVGGDAARVLAPLLGTAPTADVPAAPAAFKEGTPAAPTVRDAPTGTPARASGSPFPSGATGMQTVARPISNTGRSNTKPSALPTRAATLTSLPAGRAQTKAPSPSITRASTRTPTATATRTPSSGTCIFGCR